MKNIKWIALLLGIALYFQQANAQEVVSARENVTFEEVMAQINRLASSETEENKALIKKEAEALAKKDNEELLSLSATIYERALDDAARAEEIRTEIEKKYPNGTTVRDKAFAAMMEEIDEDKSGEEYELLYNTWASKFPAKNYDKKNQGIYDYGLFNIVDRYAKEGNISKTKELLGRLKGSEFFVHSVANVFDNLPEQDENYTSFANLLKEAYETGKEEAASEDPKIKQGRNAYFYQAVAPHYASTLLAENKYDEAINITKQPLDASEDGGYYAQKNTIVIGRAYTKKGEKENALKYYEKYILTNGKDATILAEAQKLYGDIHGASADFNTFLSGLEQQMNAAYLAKYEKDMIKKEAPAFTLVNREGKDVSLSDYKGKVVVLDFWATWCGPCIISFPGMQAAVNKYATDDEVEFLFIDTWQREENYKELVDEFMAKNNYSFHVLFDEMKDRSKATVTAFGVQGIPTKVVIDKAGFIRFQNSGSESNIEKLVKELDTKIELAKRG